MAKMSIPASTRSGLGQLKSCGFAQMDVGFFFATEETK
jgi:hypothetical protein